MTAQRRAEPVRTRPADAQPADPILEALAALIRSASDNRRARRATLTSMDGGRLDQR